MKKFFYAGIFLLGLSIIGCQKELEPIKVSSVILNSTSLSLIEGETTTLSATVTPSNAENKIVHWSTSNSDVATVNNGTVTAVKQGTATITATSDDGGKTATCQVEVKSKVITVESVSLNKTSAELTEGDELTLTATVKPDNASNKNVTWSTSDEKVATVKDGKVTAVKAGAAKITVKTEDGAKTAECAVTVKEKVYPVESVSLNKTSAELTEGDELTLTATVKPDNASNKNVTWSTSDATVATVSNGKVTAVKAGTAKITVKTEDGAKTAECTVTVKAKTISVEGISLDKTANTLMVGDTFTLTATVKPDNASNKNVTWSSSDDKVATVKDGKVTAVKVGSATITAKAGEKTTSCHVIINSPYPIPAAVDLGLSVKWASFNVGASSPEQVGNHYAWGETITKDEYTSSNYLIPKTWTSDLDRDHDVASMVIGEGWRMPTKQEIWEMQDKCTYEVTKLNDADVIKIIGPNNNYIYFPLREEYWTSSIYIFVAEADRLGHYMYFSYYQTYRDKVTERYGIEEGEYFGYLGKCVRPVSE